VDGATKNDDDLLDALWTLAVDYNTYPTIHCVLIDHEWGDMCGSLVLKPRPHNLTAVVFLDPYGPRLEELSREEGERMVQANVCRNYSYFHSNAAIRPSYLPWHASLERAGRISDFKEDVRAWEQFICKPPKKKKSKPKVPSCLERRVAEVRRFCSAPKMDLPDDFYHPKVVLREGPLSELVPSIGPVAVAVNSVVRFAAQKGYTLEYLLGRWNVVKGFRGSSTLQL